MEPFLNCRWEQARMGILSREIGYRAEYQSTGSLVVIRIA
jgi:hypothetical protein